MRSGFRNFFSHCGSLFRLCLYNKSWIFHLFFIFFELLSFCFLILTEVNFDVYGIIWDVYPGSEFFPSRMFILDPDFSSPDHGSRGEEHRSGSATRNWHEYDPGYLSRIQIFFYPGFGFFSILDRIFSIPDPGFFHPGFGFFPSRVRVFSSRIQIFLHPGSRAQKSSVSRIPAPDPQQRFLVFILLFYRSPVFHFPPPGRGLLPPPIPSPSLDLQQTSPSGGQHKDELKVVVAYNFSDIHERPKALIFLLSTSDTAL